METTLIEPERKNKEMSQVVRNLTRHLQNEQGYEAWVRTEEDFDIEEAFDYVARQYNGRARNIALLDKEVIYTMFAQALQNTQRLGYLGEDWDGNPKFSPIKGSLTDILHDVTYEHIKSELPYGADIHGRIPPASGGIFGKSRRKLKGYD